MKKTILLSAIAFSAFMIIEAQAQAQTYMWLNKTDNTVEYYAIDDIQKITFDGLINMKIKEINGTVESYAIDDIQKLTFDSTITGDSEITQKIKCILNQLKSFPNPANEQVMLKYELSESTPIEIRIYSTKGELVKHVDKGNMPAGAYTFIWDTKDNSGKKVPSGTYICHIITSNQILSDKSIIIK